MGDLAVTDFLGLRNDRGPKYIGNDRFFDLINFNYDSFVGADKILFPDRVNSAEYQAGKSIDGIFEFNFLNSSGVSVIEKLFLTNGKLYKDPDNQILISSDFQTGKCTFTTYENKLYIANGLNYQKIYNGESVTEQGAPFIKINGAGILTGNYYYAVTYVTAAGEEIIGTKSNTISTLNNSVNLELPIGYDGTISRKIYRTEANGNQLKLLASIPDNLTLDYVDFVSDASLGVNIPAVNNELPKVFFIETSKDILIGCVNSKEPTQIYPTDGLSDVFDFANFTSTSSISNDNTPIVGMKPDYDLLIIGTNKNIFILDCEDPSALSLVLTRANVGVKNGYGMVNVPTGEDFPGGVMFPTTLDDIRLFSGNFAQPVATSLDNLKTSNFGQPIKQSLASIIKSGSKFSGFFYDYKYHLAVDEKTLAFDIRNQSWWMYNYGAYSYGLYGGFLYRGLFEQSYLEEMYSDISYLGTEMEGFVKSGDLVASEDFKYFFELHIFYANTAGAKITVQIVVDDNFDDIIEEDFEIEAGSFDFDFYNEQFYETSSGYDDFKVFYINKWGRWVNFIITNTEGRLLFRGYRVLTQEVLNKESA